MKRRHSKPNQALMRCFRALATMTLFLACTRNVPGEKNEKASVSSVNHEPAGGEAYLHDTERQAREQDTEHEVPEDDTEQEAPEDDTVQETPDDDPGSPLIDSSGVCDTLAPQSIDVEWSLPLERMDKLRLYKDDSQGVAYCGAFTVAVNRNSLIPNRWSCQYRETGTLSLGKIRLWTVMQRFGAAESFIESEHVAILLPYQDGPKVIHTVDQWKYDGDGPLTLLQRYQLSKDLDGDGQPELCIETIEEVSLAFKYDSADWLPDAHERKTQAYKLDQKQWRLRRAKKLDKRCPGTGYQPFVVPDTDGGHCPTVQERRPFRAKDTNLAPCPFPDDYAKCEVIAKDGIVGILRMLGREQLF